MQKPRVNQKTRQTVSNFVQIHALRLRVQRWVDNAGLCFDEDFSAWDDKTGSTTHIKTGISLSQSADQKTIDKLLAAIISDA